LEALLPFFGLWRVVILWVIGDRGIALFSL